MIIQIKELTYQDMVWILPVMYIGFYLAALIHECGHYVIGKKVLPDTIKITEFSVGHLVVVYDRIHGDTHFTIKAILNPFGECYVTTKQTTTEPVLILRYKWVLFVTAGIVANLLWAGILFALYLTTNSLVALTISFMSFSLGIGQIFASDGKSVLQAFVQNNK